jgi:NADH:ubiquinone oxidoreductase subunit 5 (subunit L)/multisubunit Na+/H+ antiporter MnhA subunit
VPQAGVNFVLRLDGLAWLFAVLIAGIGLLVVIYARYYLSPADPVPRFFRAQMTDGVVTVPDFDGSEVRA